MFFFSNNYPEVVAEKRHLKDDLMTVNEPESVVVVSVVSSVGSDSPPLIFHKS